MQEKFLADENVHAIVVRDLRDAGFDVEWIAELAPGISDKEILERQNITERILITYDRDFGELIFHRGYPAPRAIIYSRLGRAGPREVAERILLLVEKGIVVRHVTTIIKKGERLRPFPNGVPNG